MAEIQEDTAELAIKWMIKVPRLSAELIVAGLRALLKAINDKEPIGIQKMATLMHGKNNLTAEKITSVDSQTMDADLKMLERLARKHNVGFTPLQLSGEPGWNVFFRCSRKEQMEAVIKEFMQYKFYRDFKIPAHGEQSEQASQQQSYSGEILEDRAIIPSAARQVADREPIIIDMGLVAAQRKEPIHSRLERAAHEITQQNAHREEQKRQRLPSLSRTKQERGRP